MGAAGPLCSEDLFAGSPPHGLCKLGHAFVVVLDAHRTNVGHYGLLRRAGLFSFVDGFSNYVAAGQAKKKTQTSTTGKKN